PTGHSPVSRVIMPANSSTDIPPVVGSSTAVTQMSQEPAVGTFSRQAVVLPSPVSRRATAQPAGRVSRSGPTATSVPAGAERPGAAGRDSPGPDGSGEVEAGGGRVGTPTLPVSWTGAARPRSMVGPGCRLAVSQAAARTPPPTATAIAASTATKGSQRTRVPVTSRSPPAPDRSPGVPGWSARSTGPGNAPGESSVTLLIARLRARPAPQAADRPPPRPPQARRPRDVHSLPARGSSFPPSAAGPPARCPFPPIRHPSRPRGRPARRRGGPPLPVGGRIRRFGSPAGPMWRSPRRGEIGDAGRAAGYSRETPTSEPGGTVMPIATPEVYAEMLDRAKARGFAYPAINVTSSSTLNAALRGFAEAGSDGIVQVSTGGAEFLSGQGVKDMVTGAVALAEYAHVVAAKYPVHVALHTDHCPKDKLDGFMRPLVALSQERVAAGRQPPFGPHMWDGSAVPLAENLAIAADLLAECAKAHVIMEVEIGVVGGEEDGVVGAIDEKLYSTPEDALRTAEILGTGEKGRYLLAAT